MSLHLLSVTTVVVIALAPFAALLVPTGKKVPVAVRHRRADR